MSRTLNAFVGGMLVAALIASFAFAAPEPQPSPPQLILPQGLPVILPPGAIPLGCGSFAWGTKISVHNTTQSTLSVGTTIYFKWDHPKAAMTSFKLPTPVPAGHWFNAKAYVGIGFIDCKAWVKL